MAKVTNIYNIKKAKTFVKEIGELLTVIESQLEALTPFKKYTPVVEMMALARTNRILLRAHYNKYIKQLEDK